MYIATYHVIGTQGKWGYEWQNFWITSSIISAFDNTSEDVFGAFYTKAKISFYTKARIWKVLNIKQEKGIVFTAVASCKERWRININKWNESKNLKHDLHYVI